MKISFKSIYKSENPDTFFGKLKFESTNVFLFDIVNIKSVRRLKIQKTKQILLSK